MAAIDLLGSEGGDEQTFLVEEDEAPKPVTSNVFNSETATLGLRREYGKGEQMRENLLTVLLYGCLLRFSRKISLIIALQRP